MKQAKIQICLFIVLLAGNAGDRNRDDPMIRLRQQILSVWNGKDRQNSIAVCAVQEQQRNISWG